MKHTRTTTVRLLLASTAILALWVSPSTLAQGGTSSVILITLDGARTEEIFGGLDLEVLTSTLREKQKAEDQPVYRRFWADTPEARREKLMPFFWGTLMRQHGSVAGNARIGSAVTLTNTLRFSYPGYSEILLGEAHDDVIKSNDPNRNPYATVLEELSSRLKLTTSQAAVFASWNVFDAIVEHTEGSLTVNAGYEAFEADDPAIAELSRLQFETPTPWDSVRHDLYTFQLRDGAPEAREAARVCTSRSEKPTTGRTTDATIASSTPTRAPTGISRRCGPGCSRSRRIAGARTSSSRRTTGADTPRKTGAITARRSRARRTCGSRSSRRRWRGGANGAMRRPSARTRWPRHWPHGWDSTGSRYGLRPAVRFPRTELPGGR